MSPCGRFGLAWCLFAALDAGAHVIELGYGQLKGRCTVVHQVRNCVFPGACYVVPEPRVTSQPVKVSAVVVPDKAIPGKERNEVLLGCAAEGARIVGLDNLALDAVSIEAEYRDALRACLRGHHAPFTADLVLLRREAQGCSDR